MADFASKWMRRKGSSLSGPVDCEGYAAECKR
jgi:hypothetical protein